MKFLEVLRRLNGISCPVFGVSWNPPESQRAIAREIILFLEARRILYEPYEFEFMSPSVISVTDIRNFLTSKLKDIEEGSKFEESVRAMRSACNEFLSKCLSNEDFKYKACRGNTLENMIFHTGIGNLRSVFGIMIGQIAASFGIDVEDRLAQIIPDMSDSLCDDKFTDQIEAEKAHLQYDEESSYYIPKAIYFE